MTRPPLPPLAVALAHLRSIASWSREELGHGHGLASKTIAEFEAGHRTLSRARAEQLVATLGFGPEMLDEVLADVERRRGEVSPEGSIPLPPAERRALARSQRDLSAYLAAELGRLRRLERAREERAAAGALFERLAGFTSIQRCRAVEGAEKYLSWALALRLAEESAKAAPDSAARALEYAELGLRVAERVAGAECLVPPAFGLLLRGQAWAFLANARRVAGNLPGADEGLARCDQLWEEGEGGDPDGLIDPSRRFDLKASLRKHQGRLDEALVALDQALATGLRGEAAGRVLLKKAFALEQCGQPETALATLSQAELYLDASAEPRLVCVLRFNQAVNLCH
ncbi:MAG TPA: hypothetical protein VN783_05215, partial [Thermoanaerobaculia bacterium]|nr:hypothetical protein [Thermoanaerobaculia bacterium]